LPQRSLVLVVLCFDRVWSEGFAAPSGMRYPDGGGVFGLG
jgi:hypothetical protein